MPSIHSRRKENLAWDNLQTQRRGDEVTNARAGLRNGLPLGCPIGFLLLSLTTLASPIRASAENTLSVITQVSGAPGCRINTAVQVTFNGVATSGRKLLGKCVEVRGIFYGRTIFATFNDAKKYRLYENPGAVSSDRRIGIYANDSVWNSLKTRRGLVVFVGNVGDCAELSGKPGVIMVSGYCHQNNGNYVAVSEVH
jgi:hypothetical protein